MFQRSGPSRHIVKINAFTHNRLLCNLKAIGASGDMTTLHAFGTSTLQMAFLLTLFRFDLDPSVATSLDRYLFSFSEQQVVFGKVHEWIAI